MGNVSQANICPKCNSIGTFVGTICQECGHNSLAYENQFIHLVDYVTIQAGNAMVKDLHKKTEFKEKEAHRNKVIAATYDYFRNAHPSQINAALQDAKGYMEYLLHSKADKETVKSSITLAKKIGELGTALHNYFIAGGKKHETTTETKGERVETDKEFTT